jgi:hypothetical protein
VATPTFSPAAGTYASAQTVTIGTTTSGASIRYTTDGSTPSETAGTLYSSPITVGSSTTINAIAYESGMTDSSVASAIYTISAGSGTVQFVKTDTTTQGSWRGIYGANGYNVIGATSALPSDVSVTPSGQSAYVWSSSTAAPRALQMSATSDVRLIAAWYGTTFSLNVSFNDTGMHQVALYCLDPDGGRAQTINILDAVTGRVLDSRSLANFGNGEYLAWNLSGQVVISFTSTGSANAVVSGLFFDPPGGVATPAFSPVAGTYNSAQTVTLSTATPGASIRYTTNGSAPSETAGTLYSGPITVGSSTTLNAIAYAGGLADSAIAPGNYIIGGSTSAQFVTTDTTTQGSWKGVYGANGYNVIEDTTAYPSFVTVTPAGQSNYVWSWSSASVTALEKAGSATDRIITAWYGTTFSLDVNFNDTATHRLALYCLDPDGGRAQTITILNTATGATLDSRSMASFGNGEYLVWNLSGHVTINFTSTGSNAVVSGLFF